MACSNFVFRLCLEYNPRPRFSYSRFACSMDYFDTNLFVSMLWSMLWQTSLFKLSFNEYMNSAMRNSDAWKYCNKALFGYLQKNLIEHSGFLSGFWLSHGCNFRCDFTFQEPSNKNSIFIITYHYLNSKLRY